MEHRCAKRKILSRDVSIHTQKGQHLKGSLRNVSREGMYIQTTIESIRYHEKIDVELSHDCHIRGRVVRIGNDGVGVLFIPPPETMTNSSSPPIPLSYTCLHCLEIDDTKENGHS